LEILALVFGLCRWSANIGRLFSPLYRIAQISRLYFSSALWDAQLQNLLSNPHP
jgi:hypothetical protein